MNLVEAAVHEYYQKARQLWNLQNWQKPKIIFARTGTDLGRATFTTNTLDFNLVLYRRNPEHFLREVVGHEISHLISFQLHGTEIYKDYHGPEWLNIMVNLKLEPKERYGGYSVSDLRKSEFEFEYGCSCQKIQLKSTEHRRHSVKPKRCKECKNPVQFTGDVKIISKAA